MHPLVSVVVTTYNQAPYIEEAVRSVLAQTYKPCEVIVVDDGSTDDTPARIASFNGSVFYIRQKNQGVAGSRNTGIRAARGELIAFLDGDDLWAPEKLAAQVEAARLHPKSGLIVTDGVEFSQAGVINATLLSGPCKELGHDATATGRYYRDLLHRQFISTTSQVMVPAHVFRSVGLSDMKFRRASDYDLYIRIAAKFDITIVKKPLTWWRYLETSASGPRSMREFRYLPEDIAILRKHLRESDEGERAFISSLIKSKVTQGTTRLYYCGLEGERTSASRALAKLLIQNVTYPAIALFLAGLWCPRPILTRAGRPIRRILAKAGSWS